MLPTPTEPGRRVLDAIARSKHACAFLAALETAGHDPAAVADLEAAGWLERWERSDGVALTLSVPAAARLGLDLTETWVYFPMPARYPGPKITCSAPRFDVAKGTWEVRWHDGKRWRRKVVSRCARWAPGGRLPRRP